ncbi:YigZ family protein [Pseudidiomarina sp. 1APP75-32.1]|uniref:YigZ family protein n=1 Tax=Pseudidiomarina terrestris TaxID=2820060 RepID=A0AAW7R057_9GAMM|nr:MULTISPECIES: YigZ family protein [unclassified Pseudidiomarina]MDN7125399.1 YigZ family protein [Pseudidiomarina sp. 1APP75-32.1]MDN7130157.1 YigZ family protein [Pseudidiomarina sp. 1APR75-15]MEA3588593.1 YigZ family protein [Pseudidiomarina sp. 1APP75-27a]
MTQYLIPAAPCTHEIEIKHSRFITSVQQVTSASQHQAHIRFCQQQWPGANHYCSAAIYAAPDHSQSYAMSDDGEPGGTAGRPMLQVLLNSGLGEVSVVVVRYFGGIKLGTGGLQRAYTQATLEALKMTSQSQKIVRKTAYLHYDYADQKVVTHCLAQYDAITEQHNFAATIEQQVALPEQLFEDLATALKNATQGRVALKKRQTGDNSCA